MLPLELRIPIFDRDEEHGSGDLAFGMSRPSDRMVSGRDLDQPLAQAADNDLTRPDSSSEHTDGFATATSSPAETVSEEDQEVAFRLRSRSHSQEYAFIKKDHSNSFHVVHNSTYHVLIIPLFEHSI